jgi:hypothetical protein
MPVRAEIQTSFNAGELSARMEGRSDLAVYSAGGREILNLLLTIQGPAVKRSGTEHVAPNKADAVRARLIPFVFNVTQAYVVEAGPNYFRFFTNDVQIESAPGVPYEVETPYGADDVVALDYKQSADVLYLTVRGHAPRELRRTSAVTFELVVQPLKGGPLQDQNTDDARTIGASAATGTVTLTANTATFLPGHVGAFLGLEAQDFRSIPAWEPNVEVVVNDKRRSDGKVYQAITLPASASTRTGAIQPTHFEGEEWDGSSAGQDVNDKDAGGVRWRFLYGRAALVKITAVASGTSATATVISRLPDEIVTSPTRRWSLGLFSDADGWPDTLEIRDERLIFGKGFDIAASVTGDLNDFAELDESGIFQPDLGFRRRVPGTNVIQWMASDRELLIGTAASEVALQPVNQAGGLASNNLRITSQSFYGSEKVRPLQAGTRTIFVARTGRKLREAGYDFNFDRYRSPDLTVRSEHITGPGVIEMAQQQEPEGLLWALRSDGVLACLTYDEDQDVRGWSRHVIGGTEARVESLCTIPAPDNSHDQLWLAVRRLVAGVERRTIERMLPTWREGDTLASAWFVDGGKRWTADGGPITTASGFAHLAGETVTLLADGATHAIKTVAGDGTIALDRPASNVVAGLPYVARYGSMQIVSDSQNGTSQSRIKRIVKIGLRLLETLGVRAGPSEAARDELLFRTAAMTMDAPPDLYSGEYLMGWPGGYDRDVRVSVESFQPLPFTLLSLSPRVDVGGPT